MKLNIFYTAILSIIVMFASACNSNTIVKNYSDLSDSEEILYVYDDGKMRFKSRYLNSEDVVIYSDGRGGEKAAVKVRVPIHSDFYRDSIVVVRVVNTSEKSVVKNESDDLDVIN